MERLTQTSHRGHSVLSVDYSGLRDTQAILDLIWASSDRIVAEPKGSVRVVLVVKDVHIATKTVGALKEAGLRNKPHLKGVAIVGLSGLLRVIYVTMSKVMEMEMPLFDTREQAADWLAGLP